MPIRTKRWNDPVGDEDGSRILVCRFRPRGVPRVGEPWDAWIPELGPSRALHADAYGKNGPPISWEQYAARYLAEMQRPNFWLRGLTERAATAESMTLLCSSACVDEARCHRTLLRALLLERVAAAETPPIAGRVVRRGRKV